MFELGKNKKAKSLDCLTRHQFCFMSPAVVPLERSRNMPKNLFLKNGVNIAAACRLGV